LTSNDRAARVEELWRARPVRPFVRWSACALVALALFAWLGGGFLSGELLSGRRLSSLARFVGELQPYPLRDGGLSLTGLAAWAGELWSERGQEAALITLSISTVAIVLAGALGSIATLPAVRTLATAEPFLPEGRPATPAVRRTWRAVVAAARLVLTFLRAVPEYMWVFLLIGVFGPTAWAAVLALALHNLGVLGRLNAEVVEDLDAAPLESLRSAGATRLQIAGWGVLPIALPRMLLFFFYRWETCIRESTVVGLLGILSIGYWIQDARARQQPDTMLFFILVGAALVIAGDLLSAVVRRWVREAG
jgi:phosphonate transport system permease protein